MSKAEELQRRFGSNMAESLGARAATGPAPIAATPAKASPDDGRARAREAFYLDLDKLTPDPTQPREHFDQDELERLAGSLKARGQLLPIRCRWDGSAGLWVILSGERRWRAARLAGLSQVLALCVAKELTPGERLAEQLVENLAREDLKPVEQAKGFRALMQLEGKTAKETAEALHVSPSTVSKALALLNLPEDLQQKVDAGELAASVAYDVARVEGADRQRELAAQIIGGTAGPAEARGAKKKESRRGAGRKPSTWTRRLDLKGGGHVVVTLTGKREPADAAFLKALDQAAELLRQGTERRAA